MEEAFLAAEKSIKSVKLSDQDASMATENVCDSEFSNYGTVTENDILRLSGPGTGR